MPRPAAYDEPELRAVSGAMERGLSPREIAAILYGEAAASRHWHADGWMRAWTRRRIRRARQLRGPVEGS